MSEDTQTTLRLERLIPTERELLFRLWTEPAQLVKWWAPEGHESTVHILECCPGGRWRVGMRGADGDEVASGVYRIVDPPKRLSFTWAWERPGGARGHETEVTVTLEPALGGTRLVLVQRRFETMEARDNHSHGWSASLDRMSAIVS